MFPKLAWYWLVKKGTNNQIWPIVLSMAMFWLLGKQDEKTKNGTRLLVVGLNMILWCGFLSFVNDCYSRMFTIMIWLSVRGISRIWISLEIEVLVGIGIRI
jgi:hypothetical protein